MRAGELNRLIDIDQATDVRDAAGGVTQTWTIFAADVSAKVMPKRGREHVSGDRINVEFDTVFRIRYLPGVVAKMRLRYEGVTYDIQFVAELGRREGLDLLAKVRQG